MMSSSFPRERRGGREKGGATRRPPGPARFKPRTVRTWRALRRAARAGGRRRARCGGRSLRPCRSSGARRARSGRAAAGGKDPEAGGTLPSRVPLGGGDLPTLGPRQPGAWAAGRRAVRNFRSISQSAVTYWGKNTLSKPRLKPFLWVWAVQVSDAVCTGSALTWLAAEEQRFSVRVCKKPSVRKR